MKGSDVESMTKLLKQHDVPLSAVRANKLLLTLGFLEEAERPSSTKPGVCLLYTSPSPRDLSTSRMPSSA